jgi:hypothetical protein
MRWVIVSTTVQTNSTKCVLKSIQIYVSVIKEFELEEGPSCYIINCTSPVFHVRNGTGYKAMQKPSMLRIACDNNEAVKEIISLFDKQCCSEASVVHVT